MPLVQKHGQVQSLLVRGRHLVLTGAKHEKGKQHTRHNLFEVSVIRLLLQREKNNRLPATRKKKSVTCTSPSSSSLYVAMITLTDSMAREKDWYISSGGSWSSSRARSTCCCIQTTKTGQASRTQDEKFFEGKRTLSWSHVQGNRRIGLFDTRGISARGAASGRQEKVENVHGTKQKKSPLPGASTYVMHRHTKQ